MKHQSLGIRVSSTRSRSSLASNRLFVTKLLFSMVFAAAFFMKPAEVRANPFESSLHWYGVGGSQAIISQSFSSYDGNPNPFNPLAFNIQHGVHDGNMFAFVPFRANGWFVRVTKNFYGLSALSNIQSFGWVNPETGGFGQMFPFGAPAGSQITWPTGDQPLFFVCVTGAARLAWNTDPGFPVIVTAKAVVRGDYAKYFVYCEDTVGPTSDYDYNDHGYIVEVFSAQCANGVDDDGDGLVDTQDPGCSGNPYDGSEGDATTQCQDGADNDGDGAVDLADFSCQGNRFKNDETTPRAQCQDGADNDGDGLVDLQDPGCSSNQDNNEGDGTSQCQDGVDNDGDGAVDYQADFSCQGNPRKNDESTPKAQCQDGLDNDGDRLIDLADPGCAGKQDNNEGDATSQCQDGVDNDSDGAVDYQNDFSCGGDPTKNDESMPKSQCQDGLDNDSDGLIDLLDPGCSSKQDNNEGDGTTQCQDGIDNDNDGAVDFLADFSCGGDKTKNNETTPKAQCQDGIDNDLDNLIDLSDPGCSNNQDNNEGDGTSQCQDTIDNDGDGLIDLADPGCSSPTDNNESDGTSQCQNGKDDDGDNKIDAADPGCSSPQDNNEVDESGQTKPQCSDGIDNDSDGAIDLADFSCSGDATRNNESTPKSQCQDGLDNDNDGKIDTADSDCTTAQDNSENGGVPGCIDQITVSVAENLDQIAIQIATLANESATLLFNIAKSQGSAKAAIAQRDVKRTKRIALQLLNEARSLTIKIPTVSRTCPNLPQECRQIDNTATIAAIGQNQLVTTNHASRTLARSGFRKARKTKEYKAMIQRVRSLAFVGALTLSQVPKVSVSCAD